VRKVFGKCWATPALSHFPALVIQLPVTFAMRLVLRKFGDVPDDLSAL
jgi:hypothetical protein